MEPGVQCSGQQLLPLLLLLCGGLGARGLLGGTTGTQSSTAPAPASGGREQKSGHILHVERGQCLGDGGVPLDPLASVHFYFHSCSR